jgi:alkylation response protein AidB-like acyl-CoA dehydrogenase
MQFAFTDEQSQIRETARTFLDDTAQSARVRAVLSSDLGYDAALWRQIAGEMSWAGTAIAERYGGAGLSLVELGILQHELGRRLAPSPFFSTVCLAAPLIDAVATEPQKERWLGRIAAGDVRIAVALTGRRGGAGRQSVSAELHRSDGSWRLRGESGFVIFGHACDALLVAARDCETDDETVRLVLIDPTAPGVLNHRQVMLDLTRPMSRIEFNEVSVESEAILGLAASAAATIESALDRARIALAAEALGGAEYSLEMTNSYVKERVQFDRPIGSFQAVKHRLADMMVLVEAARSSGWFAACVAEEFPEEIAEAASIAKAACCEAFVECSSNAIQLHGGVGFSWEHDAHLYFKRARATATLLGSPTWQRERIAKAIWLGDPVFTPAY